MNIRERILGQPTVYRLFKKLVLPSGVLEELVNTEYKTKDGARVLDLGCGFGDYARFFAKRCTYIGIDHNASYIATARRLNNGLPATFLVADVVDPIVVENGPYDLVMLSGVLHHLDDDSAHQLASRIAPLLNPGGRFVALEPVFDADQGLSARLLIAADRGRHVRDTAGYVACLESGFVDISTRIVSGLLRIPYTHLVITGKVL
jgi:SAM-dependent methyltransferase